MNIASVVTPLALGVLASTGPHHTPTTTSGDVSVRLVLDQSRYAPGAHGHVRVRIGEDGYLVVLYAQPDGHVDVAYPIDPGVSDAVPADTEIEIVSRGSTDAFTVEDSSGTGTWYAAISKRPFRFDSVSVHGHWDYRAVPRETDPDHVESGLTAFVKQLSTGRFDYDIISFAIDASASPTSSAVYTAPPSEAPQSAPPPTNAAPDSAGSRTDESPGEAGPEPGVEPWWGWSHWYPSWMPWTWLPPTGIGPFYDRALPGGAPAHPGSTETKPPPINSTPRPASPDAGHGSDGGHGGGGGHRSK